MNPPAYFNKIREQSVKRWEQLESDHGLAAPWHQLFKQVQSPRHIISELLQNADDAGASEAQVEISNGNFVFSHNGADFTEENFRSVCEFGYSNKRSLHTIGFRGIGFKCTFSIGDPVTLLTPTLSVSFFSNRFTEPVWIANPVSSDGLTRIVVPIGDKHKLAELKANLDEWKSSSVSLLFFRNLHKLTIGVKVIEWKSLGLGPFEGSHWLASSLQPNVPYLHIRSSPMQFPPKAMAEVSQERMVPGNQEFELPPCSVDLVLGQSGQLFVVLPTGVETCLPFACNAPFIQDPARLKIKDPSVSPTNRWLLEKTGILAGKSFLKWLNNSKLSISDRCKAYELLPEKLSLFGGALSTSCFSIVEESFSREIENRPLVLTYNGKLRKPESCVAYPEQILSVWDPSEVASIFDDEKRPPVALELSKESKTKLVERFFLDEVNERDAVLCLIETRPPKPRGWKELLTLWGLLANELNGYVYSYERERRENVNIFPVRGKEVLYSSSEVVRISEKRIVNSDEDWEFLSKYLLVANQNWFAYLTEQQRIAKNVRDEQRVNADASRHLIKLCNLEHSSDLISVMDRVAKEFFAQESITLDDSIKLAHIFAKLDVDVGPSFRYVQQDNHFCEPPIVFDTDGNVAELFSKKWCKENLLNERYFSDFKHCSALEWQKWVTSPKSGVLTFPPLKNTRKSYYSRKQLEKDLKRRNFYEPIKYHYQSETFVLNDWDFDDTDWARWKTLGATSPAIWTRILEKIIGQPRAYWDDHRSASVEHIARNGHRENLVTKDLLPGWINRLRDLSCIRDSHGFIHKPHELLLRVPATESLIDVEPFVHPDIDNNDNRRLLRLLGVGETPTGPEKILDRLKTLSLVDNPPSYEVEKWYFRLDRLVSEGSTEMVRMIDDAFRTHPILLTENGIWTRTNGAFLLSDEEDFPGVELVRRSVRDLSIWRRIGVAETPTVELAIEWLRDVPVGEPIPDIDGKRIRSLLKRHPHLIWETCHVWLNLAGELINTQSLEFAISMQSLIKYGHLHDWVKQKTADVQMLEYDVIQSSPFSGLTHLSECLVNRISNGTYKIGHEIAVPWLTRFGEELRRVKLSDETETSYIRKIGARLAATAWKTAARLEVIPYLGNEPAGMPSLASAAWIDSTIYVEDKPISRIAKPLSQELGKFFKRADLVDAVKTCLDRDPQFVSEYFAENFDLAEPNEVVEIDDSLNTGNDDIGRAFAEADNDGVPAAGPTNDTVEDGDDESPVAEVSSDTPIFENDKLEDEVDDDLFDDDEDEDDEPGRRTRTLKKSIFDTFLDLNGFSFAANGTYSHPDGTVIRKNDGVFPWERRTPGGKLRYFLPIDHCLENRPLVVEYEVWNALERYPEMHALILRDVDNIPLEVTGAEISKLSGSRKIKLFPASYRIVYIHE